MLDPGKYIVVSIGRRFVRWPECAIVGQSLDTAHQFDDVAEARCEVDWLRTEMPKEKKPIRIHRVTIEEIQ
jgi:hypothetical protein